MSAPPRSAAELTLPPGLVVEGAGLSPSVQDEVLGLFDDHGPRLCRYVRAFGLSVEAADDVVQDVFLALFRHLTLGRSRRNLQGWLFRVAHNLALKHRRSLKRRRIDDTFDAVVEALVDPLAGPEQQLLDRQRQHRLHFVLSAMHERDRHCLYLRAEGLRYREIAKVLGISLGSVARSLTGSLRRLLAVDRE
jgi:RNA polymerase sigma-70 factor, ECF subfamily